MKRPLRHSILRLWLQIIVFILALLGGAIAAQASPYYWVPVGTGTARTGNGVWNELAHWAASSGGPGGAYSQVPQSTDDVYFDTNSFTGNNQRVNLNTGGTGGAATPTCRNLTWSGNVRGATFSTPGASFTLEVNGNLRFTPLMGSPAGGLYRMLAAGPGHIIDLQNVPTNGSGIEFNNPLGEWTFTSAVNMPDRGSISLVAAARVNMGSSTVGCGQIQAVSSGTMVFDLGSSTITLTRRRDTWAITNPNLSLVAGTSTIRMGTPALDINNLVFNSTPLNYYRLVVLPGNGNTITAANASFQFLEVGDVTTVLQPLTIAPGGVLTVAPEATLRLPAGRVVTFGAGATLASGGSCAGQGVVQSTSMGARATLARAGGWASAPLSFLALQDLAFTTADGTTPGAAVATSCADDGNNAGIALTPLAVSDLYWVGGTGNWHDPAHWATSSGGSSAGNSCLPGVSTNVHFDANSFPTAGQRVTLDGTAAECRDMDWTGTTNLPALVKAAAFRTLAVRGSLTLVAGLTQDLPIDLFVGGYAAGSTYTLATAGQVLTANLWVRCPGSTLRLLDALRLAPPSATSPAGRLWVEAGTLATNNLPVSAQGVCAGFAYVGSLTNTGSHGNGPVSTAAAGLDLGSSVLTLTGPAPIVFGNGPIWQWVWDVSPAVQLSAGTSTLNMLTNGYQLLFRSGLGLRYATVNFGDAPAALTPRLLAGAGAASTYGQLRFAGPASIEASTSITGTLRLAAGRKYNFASNTTHTFDPGATLDAVGSCAGYIDLAGAVGGTAVRFVGSTAVPLQYVQLRNTAFSGGAGWQAQASLDNGLNTGIAFTPAPARRLYWVGNGGNWSDAAHWATSSGGAGGSCVPSAFDDVVLDASSFNATGQVLVFDQPTAVCRSLDCRAVTNNPTLSSVKNAATNNTLSVYGPVTWAPAPNMTLALFGDLSLLGSGTLTSAGQRLNGSLLVNVPGGTVTLADDFVQNTSGTTLLLLAGTLNTNNKRLTVGDFQTGDPLAKTLTLGTSRVEVNGSWQVQDAPQFTLNAGTSAMYFTNGALFRGSNHTYNRVVMLNWGEFFGSNTFRSLRLLSTAGFRGNNTLLDSLRTDAGKTYVFAAGTTTTFGRDAVVLLPGTGSNPITLQSNTPGGLFTWSKPAGGVSVCADYSYIRDSRATGGAYFEAGKNGANNQRNNPGWSFGFPPRATYRGRYVCPAEGPHTMRFTFSSFDITNNAAATLTAAQFPLTMVLKNLTTGTTETISVPANPYDYLIPTSTAVARYQVVSLATSASGGCGTIENTDPNTFAVATDAVLSGAAGTWTGAGVAADGSWTDCQNWANGAVPTLATDVVVNPNATAVAVGSGLVATVPVQPALTTAGALARNITVPAGASFTAGPAGRLTVAGDWLNRGSMTFDAASQVTFAGAAQQTIGNGQFGSVVVNNPAGLTLTADASTSGTLTLTAGLVSTGIYQWGHTNSAPGSLSGYSASSYVLGNLRRAVAPATSGTYAFPVGLATRYALLEIVGQNLTGLTQLTAKFGARPGTDAGLSFSEGPATPRYQSVHPVGVWTLTPDAQPTGGRYDVRAGLAPFFGITDNQFAVLKRPDASSNAADWTGGGGTLNPDNGAGRRVADGYALRKGLSSFSQFGIGLSNASPLPVTLVYFGASRRGPDAQLSWRTASEVNSAYFEVQGSPDGAAWQTLATVAAAGTTATPQAYAHLDRNIARYGSSAVYYRLRQVDTDGTAHYSPVAAVALGAVQWQAQAYPTAFSTTLTAQLTTADAGPVTLQLLDPLGRVLARQEQAVQPGSQTLAVEGVAQVPAGVYFLLVRQGGHATTIRVVRQ